MALDPFRFSLDTGAPAAPDLLPPGATQGLGGVAAANATEPAAYQQGVPSPGGDVWYPGFGQYATVQHGPAPGSGGTGGTGGGGGGTTPTPAAATFTRAQFETAVRNSLNARGIRGNLLNARTNLIMGRLFPSNSTATALTLAQAQPILQGMSLGWGGNAISGADIFTSVSNTLAPATPPASGTGTGAGGNAAAASAAVPAAASVTGGASANTTTGPAAQQTAQQAAAPFAAPVEGQSPANHTDTQGISYGPTDLGMATPEVPSGLAQVGLGILGQMAPGGLGFPIGLGIGFNKASQQAMVAQAVSQAKGAPVSATSAMISALGRQLLPGMPSVSTTAQTTGQLITNALIAAGVSPSAAPGMAANFIATGNIHTPSATGSGQTDAGGQQGGGQNAPVGPQPGASPTGGQGGSPERQRPGLMPGGGGGSRGPGGAPAPGGGGAGRPSPNQGSGLSGVGLMPASLPAGSVIGMPGGAGTVTGGVGAGSGTGAGGSGLGGVGIGGGGGGGTIGGTTSNNTTGRGDPNGTSSGEGDAGAGAGSAETASSDTASASDSSAGLGGGSGGAGGDGASTGGGDASGGGGGGSSAGGASSGGAGGNSGSGTGNAGPGSGAEDGSAGMGPGADTSDAGGSQGPDGSASGVGGGGGDNSGPGSGAEDGSAGMGPGGDEGSSDPGSGDPGGSDPGGDTGGAVAYRGGYLGPEALGRMSAGPPRPRMGLSGVGANYAQGGVVNAAALGPPNPPGPDDGYAFLDGGEFVVRASEVPKYLGTLQAINEGRHPPDGPSGMGFAHGGLVPPMESEMDPMMMGGGQPMPDDEMFEDDYGGYGDPGMGAGQASPLMPPDGDGILTADSAMMRAASLPPDIQQAMAMSLADPNVMGAWAALLGPSFAPVLTLMASGGQQQSPGGMASVGMGGMGMDMGMQPPPAVPPQGGNMGGFAGGGLVHPMLNNRPNQPAMAGQGAPRGVRPSWAPPKREPTPFQPPRRGLGGIGMGM